MKGKLNELGENQIIKHYNQLNGEEKKQLLSHIDISKIELAKKLYRNMNNEKIKVNQNQITPADIIYKKDYIHDTYYTNIGKSSIKNGEIGVVILAGGLGTRLGHAGPKGTFELDYKGRKKSLYEFLLDKCKKSNEEFDIEIPIYILCSNNNINETKDFFKENNYFSYPQRKIKFFIQDELPVLDINGKLILKDKTKIIYGPNGNGNVFKALNKSGYIEDMKKNNIKWLIFTGIDNIFVNLIDPLFIGLTIDNSKTVASKSITKTDEMPDRIFIRKNDRFCLQETKNIEKNMLNKKDKEGKHLFREYDVLCHLVNYSILKELSEKELDYHPALKKTIYYKDGKIITPDQENSYKFETYIYEAFYDYDPLIFSINKNEFFPLKNKTGKNSIEEVQNKLNLEYTDI